MNDRFKVRVWNKENKEMEYDPKYPCIEGCTLEDGFETLERLQYILMQCTGLKDKNEKLIYEGDIVKGSLFKDLYGEIKFGVYANPWNSDQWTGHCGFYVEWNDNSTRKDLGFWTNEKMCFEILGNIYENPELLTPKQC